MGHFDGASAISHRISCTSASTSSAFPANGGMNAFVCWSFEMFMRSLCPFADAVGRKLAPVTHGQVEAA